MDVKPSGNSATCHKPKLSPKVSQEINCNNISQSNKYDKSKLTKVPIIPLIKSNTTTNQQAFKSIISPKNKAKTTHVIKRKDVYPRNVNEYEHFIKDFHLMIPDIAWSFGMRHHRQSSTRPSTQKNDDINNDDNNENNKGKKPTNDSAPSFYDKDLQKYKQKNLPRSTSAMNITHKGNWFGVDHLTKTSNGHTVSGNMFNFQTTLRTFYPNKTGFSNPNDWKGSRYEVKKRAQSSCPIPSKVKEKNSFVKIEKYSIRPYNQVIDKLEVGKDIIKRRRYVIDKNALYDIDGQHLSSLPYTEDYGEKNISPIRFMLSNRQKSNTQLLFELGMRTYDDSKKDRKDRNERIQDQRQLEKASKTKMDAARKKFES